MQETKQQHMALQKKSVGLKALQPHLHQVHTTLHCARKIFCKSQTESDTTNDVKTQLLSFHSFSILCLSMYSISLPSIHYK